MNELKALQKKMYDVYWNGVDGDFDELEQEFNKLVDEKNIDLEVVNEMQDQLKTPPYRSELLPEHLKEESDSTELDKRLKEIVEWLEIKGVEVTEMDKDHFERVLMLATNDGYRKAMKIGGI